MRAAIIIVLLSTIVGGCSAIEDFIQSTKCPVTGEIKPVCGPDEKECIK